MPKKRLNTRGAITLQTVIITAVLALAAAGVGIIVYNTIGGKTENLAATNNLLEEFNSDEKVIVDVLAAGASSHEEAVVALRSPDDDPTLTDDIRAIRYKQISGRFSHSCAIRGTDKEVWCWGDDSDGRLGGESPMGLPVKVPGLSNILSVAVGEKFSCALLNNGAVKCWGFNNIGQLGNGTTDTSRIPVTVDGITGASFRRNPNQIAISITAGLTHTCAILEDTTAKCWGANRNGQLGDGTTNRSLTPVQVLESAGSTTPLRNIVSIAAGHNHTCAVIMGGTAKCWGKNRLGQLGTGPRENTRESFIPVPVADLGGTGNILAVSISSGNFHTCAVVTDNKARCWGLDQDGQIGSNYIGTSNPFSRFRELSPLYQGYVYPEIPTKVWEDYSPSNSPIELDNVNSISPGENHTCSLRMINQVGQVWCWGGALHGQLGIDIITTGYDGIPSSSGTPPSTQIRNSAGETDPITRAVLYDDDNDDNTNEVALDNIKGVSSGQHHSCALSNDDRVWCWGSNANSRLGLPTVGTSNINNLYKVATELPFPQN